MSAEITLSGSHALLEPLSLAHERDLTEAVRDGELWRLWYTNVPSPEAMGAEIARRIKLRDQGSMIPFAVVDVRTGAAVGMTTYMHIDAINRHVEIGSTWYRASAQRTPINTECKLLLLSYAFETMASIAVEFRTSSFNLPSRCAIERLGAHLDGVLRSHQLHANGTPRDTYAYSITAAEWPDTREKLKHRLNQS